MSKRKYEKYWEAELASKQAQKKRFSESHEKSSGKNHEQTADSNHWRDSTEHLERDSSSSRSGVPRTSNTETGGRSNQIAKLLDALDDFILFESEEVGQPTATERHTLLLTQCKALGELLRRQRKPVSSALASITLASSAARTSLTGYTKEKLSQVPTHLSLMPWTSACIPKVIPALPEIKSPTLEAATFTHSGVTSNANQLSYERLEWLGDAYLYLCSTILISSTFTGLPPGKSSQIREILVKNETLASYSRRYGFEKRVRLPVEFSDDNRSGKKAKELEKVKVMGDIFEAYVAAVVLSDPEQGVGRICSWLKSLWAQTIASKIRDQERLSKKMEAISASDTNANVNPKDMLARTIGAKGVKITYRDAGPERKDPQTGLPLFNVGVYLDGWGEQDKQLGTGKGSGKSEAGMKAAEKALANKGLISMYAEMKRVYDAKLKAEKEGAATELGGVV